MEQIDDKDKPQFRFKYKCDTHVDETSPYPIKPYRKSCDTCSVREVCLTEPGVTYSEGTAPVEKFCPYSGNKLSLASYDYIDPHPAPFIIFKKMSKAEIKVDRKARAANHFKKEIFPTLPKSEQIHFMHKYPDLKPTVNVHKKD